MQQWVDVRESLDRIAWELVVDITADVEIVNILEVLI